MTQPLTKDRETEIKTAVRRRYATIATGGGSCCGPSAGGASGAGAAVCCGPAAEDTTAEDRSRAVGYSEAEIAESPAGAVLGLGCGNPTALAELREGETVLDLGSGAGFDVFLAAARVGPTGRAIGVDMTPEMVAKARQNAAAAGHANVEFLLGDVEQRLPLPDASVDVIISNCVLNLTTDKLAAFREAFRVLRPGGRLMVSDLVTEGELPADVRRDLEAWAGCIAGALEKQDYLDAIGRAGFSDVAIAGEQAYAAAESGEGRVVSVQVRARRS